MRMPSFVGTTLESHPRRNLIDVWCKKARMPTDVCITIPQRTIGLCHRHPVEIQWGQQTGSTRYGSALASISPA
jgi:hypothetical protein